MIEIMTKNPRREKARGIKKDKKRDKDKERDKKKTLTSHTAGKDPVLDVNRGAGL